MRPRLLRALKLASIPVIGLTWIALAGSSGNRWPGTAPGPVVATGSNERADDAATRSGSSFFFAPGLASNPWVASVAKLADAVLPDWGDGASVDRDREPIESPPRLPPVVPSSTWVVVGGSESVDSTQSSSSAAGGALLGGAATAESGAVAGAGVTTSAASSAFAAEFESCRTGAQGGGYDPSSGLWAWTCANFDWHATLDPSQAGAFRSVDCTGLRTPDAACRRSGERLAVGVLHAAGVAADFTVPGGVVLWPLFAGKDHGIYVDRGAGVLADGTTRAKIPPAEQLDVRALIGPSRYAATGASARRHAIQALNVRHIGEVPGTFELDSAGIPRRRGVWYVTDKGPHPDGNPATGADLEDGPGLDIEPATAALMVGSQLSFSAFNDLNFCDDTSSTNPRCRLDRSGDAFAGRVHWEYGTMSRLQSISEGTAAHLCLSNFVGGDEESTTGTCPGDRRMRCWASGATTLRSAGGCIWDIDGSGGQSIGDFDLSEGVGCQGFVDALEYDVEARGRQLELGVVFNNCVDDPTSAVDCSFEMGNHLRRVSIQDFIGGSCAPDSRGVFVGTGRSQAFGPVTNLAEVLDPSEVDVDLVSGGALSVGQSIRVDDELMRISNRVGNTVTVERGIAGTTPAIHVLGSAVLASASFNGTTSVWIPNYQIDGNERVLAVAPARLLQASGGFENISLMPSDHRGSARCVSGTEAACDGTVGIAFNSGAGFYRNGAILYPTYTGTNASFFDGSNLSERVLVEDIQVYGPTRGGSIFDIGARWTMRRAIVEHGDPTSNVLVLSTFGDGITIEDSTFRYITATDLIKVGLVGPQRGFVLRNNRFIGNGGGGGEIVSIGTAIDFLIEENEFVGNAGVTPIKLRPSRALLSQTVKTYLRNGIIRNNLFSGNELRANGGEDAFAGDTVDVAKASIMIRDDETVTNTLNEISNLSIYDNTMIAMRGAPHDGGTVAHQDYPCLVWLEQDDSPASLMEKSWPNIQIYSNLLEAGVGGRVVCAGDTDPGYRNASASIDLLDHPHPPITSNNVVDGSAEPSTRFLDAWNVRIDAPRAGQAFLFARANESVIPVRFDCAADGGTDLGQLELSLEECNADASSCAPIGGTATLTSTGTTVVDKSFTESVIDRGDWLKVSIGEVAWTESGTVSCSLTFTR